MPNPFLISILTLITTLATTPTIANTDLNTPNGKKSLFFLLYSVSVFDVSVEEFGAGFGLGLGIVLVDVGYLDIATA
jgi:hypothetical protein